MDKYSLFITPNSYAKEFLDGSFDEVMIASFLKTRASDAKVVKIATKVFASLGLTPIQEWREA